ncbi:MAG: hypothetical protein JRN20_11680 [Nitrososphaerota archaeon]|nr:hypothetical protein [Nitrososphaerota archaeon]MDG6923216.1 hypothetical protein [Nitrososphaerota archaeon]
MPSKIREVLRIVTILLAIIFLLSSIMNFGEKIPLGFTLLAFASPSSSIAAFEILIGVLLLASAVFSRLYVYGAAYLLAIIGLAEGLLSSDVQGLTRTMHESMIPFVFGGLALLTVEARSVSKSRGTKTSKQKSHEIITVLQFFVGGLVTLGGAAYTRSGTYPVGTALGSVHLVVGLTGLFAGYAFVKRRSWSGKFLVTINSVTIVYSAFAESLAEIYAYLPRGINDALVGTIIAIVVSVVIIYMLSVVSKQPSSPDVQVDARSDLNSLTP